MIAGIADKVTKAATSDTSELYCPWNCMVPSGKVQRVSLSRMHQGGKQIIPTDDHGQGPHRRQRRARQRDTECAKKSRTKNSHRSRRHPEVRLGTDRKNPRRIRMFPDTPNAVCTRMTARRVLVRWISRITRYTGIMATVIGNMRPRVRKLNASSLPLNCIRANTKAARLQATNTPAVADTMTTRLLRSKIQNEDCSKIWP